MTHEARARLARAFLADCIRVTIMGYRVRDGLSFCMTGQRAIFLDIKADRYFGLRPQLDQAFQAFAHRGEQLSDFPLLIGAGVLVEDPHFEAALQPTDVRQATREIPINRVSPVGGLAMRFVAAQWKATVALRIFRFEALIRHLERRSHSTARIESAKTEEAWLAACSAFAASAPFRLRSRHCLTSSLAFLDGVAASGLRPTLVFGVNAAPFSAHCWVQAGDYVLNDRLENIMPFQPILAV